MTNLRLCSFSAADTEDSADFLQIDVKEPKNLHAIECVCKGKTPLVVTLFKSGVTLKAFKHASPRDAVAMIDRCAVIDKGEKVTEKILNLCKN